MKLEVRTFVRHSSPWICSICPTCGKSVCQSENFCKNCGQELSFESFNIISKDGGHSFDLPPTWSEIVIDDKIRKMRFMQGLKELERTCNIKDNSILKIMREQFIKTCFEG